MRHLVAAAAADAPPPHSSSASGGAAVIAAFSVIACCGAVFMGLALCMRMARGARPSTVPPPASSDLSDASTPSRSRDESAPAQHRGRRAASSSLDKPRLASGPWLPAKVVETPFAATLHPPEQSVDDVSVSSRVHRDEQSVTYTGKLHGLDVLVVYVGLDAQQLLRELPRLATAAAVKHENLAATYSVQVSPQPAAAGTALCDTATASVRLVHEACSGGSLGAAATGEAARAFTALEVVELLRDVGSGLAALHAQGVCHGGVREHCVLLQEAVPDDSQHSRRFIAKLLPYGPPCSHETMTRSFVAEKDAAKIAAPPSRAGDVHGFGQLARVLLDCLQVVSQETGSASSHSARDDIGMDACRSLAGSEHWDVTHLRSMHAAEAEDGPSTVEGGSPCERIDDDQLGPLPTLFARASDTSGNGSAMAAQRAEAPRSSASSGATVPSSALAELEHLAAACTAPDAAERASLSDALATLKMTSARLRSRATIEIGAPSVPAHVAWQQASAGVPQPSATLSEGAALAAPWTNVFEPSALLESAAPTPLTPPRTVSRLDATASWGRSDASYGQSDASVALTSARDIDSEPRIPPSTFFNDSLQPGSNSSLRSVNSTGSGALVLSMPPVPLRSAAGLHAGGSIAEVQSRESSDLESDTDRHLAQLTADVASDGGDGAPPPLEATLSGMSDAHLSPEATLTGSVGGDNDRRRRRRSSLKAGEAGSPVSPPVRLALQDAASSDPETPRNLDSPGERPPAWRGSHTSPLRPSAASGLFGWSGKPSVGLPPLPPRPAASRTEPLTGRNTTSPREAGAADEGDDLPYSAMYGVADSGGYMPPPPRPQTLPAPPAPPPDGAHAGRERRFSDPAGRSLHGVPLRFLQRRPAYDDSSSSDSDAGNTTPIVVVSRGGVVRRVETRSAPVAGDNHRSWNGDPHHAELEGNSSDSLSALTTGSSHAATESHVSLAGAPPQLTAAQAPAPARLTELRAVTGARARHVYTASSDLVSSPPLDSPLCAESVIPGAPLASDRQRPTPRMAQQLQHAERQRVANPVAAGSTGRPSVTRSEADSAAFHDASCPSESGGSSVVMLAAPSGPAFSFSDHSEHDDASTNVATR